MKLATQNKTIDVTHVIPYMHPRSGGPPVVVDRLCRELKQHDWRVHVVTTDLYSEGESEAWTEPFRSAYEMDVFSARGPGSFGYAADLKSRLESIVSQSRLVQLHTVWTYASLAAAQACRKHDVPYLVMPHGMLDPASMGRRWWKKQVYGQLIEWRNLRRAAGMIYTHSEEQRLAEETVSGLPPGFIMPLGADAPPEDSREVLTAEFLSQYPELADKERIVFLSRIHGKKGLDLLIPAMAKLAQQRPQAHLILVGQGAPAYELELKTLARQCGAADRITWTGQLAGRAKWAALAASQVFALSSYQENFALVVVEAMRMGLPVVLTRRVNICEDVVSAGAGLECQLNADSVAETLNTYLSNAEQMATAGELGKQLVAERFTWERAAERLMEIYQTHTDA